MRHTEFTELFRDLARRHQLLHHTDDKPRFVRAVVSSDPIQRTLDLIELETAIRNRIKALPVMVLTSFEGEYQDNGADNRMRQCFASMMILDRAKTPDQLEAVLDSTHQIGAQVMGQVLEYFRRNRATGAMSANDISIDPLDKVADDLAGTRFTFAFSVVANAELAPNNDVFDPA